VDINVVVPPLRGGVQRSPNTLAGFDGPFEEKEEGKGKEGREEEKGKRRKRREILSG